MQLSENNNSVIFCFFSIKNFRQLNLNLQILELICPVFYFFQTQLLP